MAYNVEMSRLGKITDYEKLVVEITTDGSISPDHAFLQASKLLRDHFDLFTPAGAEEEDDEPTAARGLHGDHEERMRHKRGGSKLGRLTAHRWALFRNLLTALFTHERITTTLAKAKAVRPLADHMVTLAKQDTLHARRQALALVPDVVVVRRLFDTVGARYSGPPGRVHAHPPDGHAPRRRRPGGDPGAGGPAGGPQGEGRRRARSPPSRRAKRRRRRGRRRPRRGAARRRRRSGTRSAIAGCSARGAHRAPLAASRAVAGAGTGYFRCWRKRPSVRRQASSAAALL